MPYTKKDTTGAFFVDINQPVIIEVSSQHKISPMYLRYFPEGLDGCAQLSNDSGIQSCKLDTNGDFAVFQLGQCENVFTAFSPGYIELVELVQK